MLKTLLLEAYSREYPTPRLLAKDIKQRLHDGEIVSYGLDAYCMMLERVTEYLTAIEDATRLDWCVDVSISKFVKTEPRTRLRGLAS